MMRRASTIISVLMAVLLLTLPACSRAGNDPKTKGGSVILMSTSLGDVKIELYDQDAPETVKNFLSYVNDKFYDGTIFHRVIAGFMIQGGGLTTDMAQKPTKPPIKNESSNGLKNEPYTLAMARTSVPDSATSQFFINVKNNDFLNKASAQDGVGYAVFGKVIEGMDIVNKIEKVQTGPSDVPNEPVVIKSVTVSANEKK
ncbi:MAG: peptidyl-prolyl cis-trans isomerase [Deltaproteobacteria bacterium]|nr:peptidyl-prolyl cis-trans isomerase [Deltaproteobacteria bacterium]